MSVPTHVFRRLSPAGSNARLSIFVFHRVLPAPDPLFPDVPDAQRFSTILRWLKRWFNVLPLDEAVKCLTSGCLPERAAAITFDDGYADNVQVAFPLLRDAGLTATFFIATGFLDGGRMWNDTVIDAIRAWPTDVLDGTELGIGRHALRSAIDRRSAIEACIGRMKYHPAGDRGAQADALARMAGIVLSRDLMMTSADVRRLHRSGMGIGGHTVSHPILRGLAPAEARGEIERGRADPESIVEDQVRLFAYPNGRPGQDYDDTHVNLVRELGFAAAFSTTAWCCIGAGPTRCRSHVSPHGTVLATMFGMRLARILWQARLSEGNARDSRLAAS